MGLAAGTCLGPALLARTRSVRARSTPFVTSTLAPAFEPASEKHITTVVLPWP